CVLLGDRHWRATRSGVVSRVRPKDRIDDAVSSEDDEIIHAALLAAGIRIEEISELADGAFGGRCTERSDDARTRHPGRDGVRPTLRSERGWQDDGEQKRDWTTHVGFLVRLRRVGGWPRREAVRRRRRGEGPRLAPDGASCRARCRPHSRYPRYRASSHSGCMPPPPPGRSARS